MMMSPGSHSDEASAEAPEATWNILEVSEIEGSAEMFISRMKQARHLVFGVLQIDSPGACRGQ
jgi:hypothetical protein